MSERHWSFSELTTYMRCPLRHFFEYELALPKRSTPSSLVLGSAIHEALAVFHQSIQQGSPLAKEVVKKEFLQAWEERKREGTIVFQHQTERDAVDQGVSLLDLYLRQPPPRNVVGVEQRLLTPLANSSGEVLEKQFVGVLDLVTRDEEDGLKVTDFKTSSRSYSEYEALLSLQPTAYLHAAQHHYQEPAVFEYMVLLKINKPRIQQLAAARTPTDFYRLGDLVEAIDRAVTLGVHYPVESVLNCSSCPFRKPCRSWQSEQGIPDPIDRIPLPLCNGEDHAA